ncbi:Scavenger receptor class B member 1 [Liparis tanakae]|uniref:Scavenger receptor class B member 1 n=1 Tax=Liparis tanakae TaxID=230148 RepID=A0A4Z2F309_9TELE|nr:Scavenger receptor class B member 1 [Liparis tanakae]
MNVTPWALNVPLSLNLSLQLTGVPLNVSIRLQLNLYMKRVSAITETGKISEVVMPMIWFEESGSIDGPILSTFHTNLVVLPAVMEYMQYGFIALGVAIVLIAALVHHRVKVGRIPPLLLSVPPLSSSSSVPPLSSSSSVPPLSSLFLLCSSSLLLLLCSSSLLLCSSSSLLLSPPLFLLSPPVFLLSPPVFLLFLLCFIRSSCSP